jgi:hypothetical protein
MDSLPVRTITTPSLEEHYEMFREEDRAFLLLCCYLIPVKLKEIERCYDLGKKYPKHPDTWKYKEWLEYPNSWLETEVKSIPTLKKFFGDKLTTTESLQELLAPLKVWYSEHFRRYADIYSIDISAKEGGIKVPIVLWLGTRYLGHIYGQGVFNSEECSHDQKHGYIEFIGIRESLHCTLVKQYNKNPIYQGIAYSLLDACKEYGNSLQAKKITLACPIGNMIHISKKYGFIDDELIL